MMFSEMQAPEVLPWIQRQAKLSMAISKHILLVLSLGGSLRCITKTSQHRVIKNLTAVLEAAGTTIDNVVKVNVFLADMGDFKAMNVRRVPPSSTILL